MKRVSPERWLPEVAAVASGLLLSLAYPGKEEPAFAWFALVPFFAALSFVRPGRGFRIGWLSGMAFWCASIAWLWSLKDNGGPWALVILGHVSLSAYCALYFGLFGWLMAALPLTPSGRSGDGASPWPGLGRALLAAVAWTGLEWVRSTFLTGFAWNHLGTSQYRSLPLLQLASLGGVYAVSFLAAFLNAALANVAVRLRDGWLRRPVPRRHLDLMVALLALMGAMFWGTRELRRETVPEGTELRVAGVQPDAPSVFERGEETMTDSLKRLSEQTGLMASLRPDLIVWPETVLPGEVPSDLNAMFFAFEHARVAGAPVLAGAVEYRRGEGPSGRDLVANVSWLFEPDRVLRGRYRKQHLVPFGEYMPLDSVFPVLERLSPVGLSCTEGREPALMPIRRRDGDGTVCVSPLICFEDTVAPLASRAVRLGAEVLVNQSNDSWFEGSSEPLQHHAQAVFRAVETRTPLVRVSNAGISGIISANGRQSTDAPTAAFCETAKAGSGAERLTLYARFGDWLFSIPCAMATAVLAALLVRRRRLGDAATAPENVTGAQ